MVRLRPMAMFMAIIAMQMCASLAIDLASPTAISEGFESEILLSGNSTDTARRGSKYGPISSVCKKYSYNRYIRVKSLRAFRAWGQKARPGDMIELVAGRYFTGNGKPSGDPGQGFREPSGIVPTVAKEGTIFRVSGTKRRFITFCGDPEKTIIDGIDSKQYSLYGIRAVHAKFVRIAGFTVQNSLKGIDVQATTNSVVAYIKTRKTLQEGIRVRYGSKHNHVKHNYISDTGLLYAGVGEGVYVGTSWRNSIEYDQPVDRSDGNIITKNVFGRRVRAEAIDIKEFTRFGRVYNNKFDGSGLSGENGAISWVVVKGNNWKVFDNYGTHAKRGQVGYRVVEIYKGEGRSNLLSDNKCSKMNKGTYCLYVDPDTKGNKISCSNSIVGKKSAVKLCNCSSRCAKSSYTLARSAILGGVATVEVTPTYSLAEFSGHNETESARPAWLD